MRNHLQEGIFTIPNLSKDHIIAKYKGLIKEPEENKQKKYSRLKTEILKKTTRKLNQKKIQMFQKQNQLQIDRKVRKMKNKMKELINQKKQQSEVLKQMQKNSTAQSLSSLLLSSNRPFNFNFQVDLKVKNKLVNFRQVVEVQKGKNKYRRWLNTVNNSPLKSPNFSKMNFVFQKINRRSVTHHRENNNLSKKQQREEFNFRHFRENQTCQKLGFTTFFKDKSSYTPKSTQTNFFI